MNFFKDNMLYEPEYRRCNF